MSHCIIGQQLFGPPLRRTVTAPAPASTCAVAGSLPVRTISLGPSQEAATSAVDARRQTIACLPSFLKAQGLEHHTEGAKTWCSIMGAAWMEEVFQNAADIVQALQMSDSDAARFLAVAQPASLRTTLDKPKLVTQCAAPAPLASADVVQDAALRCPGCRSSNRMLRCVTIAAQHEGWGRKWNECAYVCSLCQRQIRRESCVNVCAACKQFWHGNCNKAAEEDVLAELAASQAAARAANLGPGKPTTRVFTKRTKATHIVKNAKQLWQKASKHSQPSVPLYAACNAELPKPPILQRSSTCMVTTQWQGAETEIANCAPSTNLLLNRTTSTPATEKEKGAATHRESTAYVPLRSWNFQKALASRKRAGKTREEHQEKPLSAHEYLIETTEPLPNQLDRTLRLERQGRLRQHQAREARVDSELLRRPIPPDAELQNPFLPELQREKAVQAEMETQKQSFDQMRANFMNMHGSEIRNNLQSVFSGQVKLEPAPVAPAIKKQFMESCLIGGTTIVPAYHGSNGNNYSSIFERGLLIPGRRNELTIVNGAAHGRGIYTAQVGAPQLSRSFCTEPKMLVCGVVDDAQALLSMKACGSKRISAESEVIRHVGDAVVVFDEKRVVPLYQASGDEFKSWFSSQGAGNNATGTLNSWLGAMAPGSGLPNPNWPQVCNQSFVDAGKRNIFHRSSRQLAFMPPQPLDATKHEIKQKRVYERKVRQQGRMWFRAEKMATHDS